MEYQSCCNKRYETSIFRIIQEIFINITRHAQATRVDIELAEESGEAVITVRDNGVGIKEFQILNPESFGIIGMNERAQQLGGKIEIMGIPSEGSVVTLRLPLAVVETSDGESIHD